MVSSLSTSCFFGQQVFRVSTSFFRAFRLVKKMYMNNIKGKIRVFVLKFKLNLIFILNF